MEAGGQSMNANARPTPDTGVKIPEGMRKAPAVRLNEMPKTDDTFALDPETLEDGRHYRWVKETPQRITRHKMRGYRIESLESGVRPMLEEGDSAGDTRIRNGDSVLMSCEEEAYRGRRRAAEDLAGFRTRTVGDSVRKEAKKKGVRTFKRSPDEDEDE